MWAGVFRYRWAVDASGQEYLTPTGIGGLLTHVGRST